MTLVSNETEQALNRQYDVYAAAREEYRKKIEELAAENEKLRAALKPFADMGRVMMGRKHHNEAVIQYALAPTIFVHHLVSAHNARAALEGPRDRMAKPMEEK